MKYNSLPGSLEQRLICDTIVPPYIGMPKTDTSIKAVEQFLKDQINKKKNCGCPICNRERMMFRAIQYIVSDYKDLRDIQEPKNYGPCLGHPIGPGCHPPKK